MDWPDLPYEAWHETRDTLHMYIQIVGKVRAALTPVEEDWGHAPLYVTARGGNTSPIPHPNGVFDIDVDFIDHVLSVRTTEGRVDRIRLEARTVADFYSELMTVTSFSEVVELSTAHARKQFETATAQGKELAALAQKVATETAEPIKESVTKAFKKVA